MPFIPSPHRTAERIRQTNALKEAGQSDVERWSNPLSFATVWKSRAKRAAKLVQPGASVLDIGCGAMALRDFLPEGCTYMPADIVSRTPDCIVVDLNTGPYPAIGSDAVTMLGVLEYIRDPDSVLRQARKYHDQLIFSYVTHARGSVESRRAMGWVSDFTLKDICGTVQRTGWRLDSKRCIKRRWRTSEYLFSCK